MNLLRLSRAVYDEIRKHGEATYPHECCGVMLGNIDPDANQREVIASVRCGNTRLDSPNNRYNIDPKELIAAQKQAREQGLDIVGFYHSHPDHPARWSETDFQEAHWYGCSYVITSVNKGEADLTASFALLGSGEDDKRFEDEVVEIQ